MGRAGLATGMMVVGFLLHCQANIIFFWPGKGSSSGHLRWSRTLVHFHIIRQRSTSGKKIWAGKPTATNGITPVCTICLAVIVQGPAFPASAMHLPRHCCLSHFQSTTGLFEFARACLICLQWFFLLQ